MSIDIQVGANPLNVPQLNTGSVSNMLDTTLLGIAVGSAIGDIPKLDTGAVANTLDTTLLGVAVGTAIGDIPKITAADKVTITGTTAGSIILYQNLAATGQTNEVYAFVSGYENDTTTNQTGTYSIPFVTVAPDIAENTSGLTISTTGTVLTITAPDATTIYNGFISIKGVI